MRYSQMYQAQNCERQLIARKSITRAKSCSRAPINAADRAHWIHGPMNCHIGKTVTLGLSNDFYWNGEVKLFWRVHS